MLRQRSLMMGHQEEKLSSSHYTLAANIVEPISIRYSSSVNNKKRMLSISILTLALVLQQHPTLAATRGNHHHHRSAHANIHSDVSSSWYNDPGDYSYSSDASVPYTNIQQQQQPSRRYRSSELYESESEQDEDEERILLALANNNDDDAERVWKHTSTENAYDNDDYNNIDSRSYNRTYDSSGDDDDDDDDDEGRIEKEKNHHRNTKTSTRKKDQRQKKDKLSTARKRKKKSARTATLDRGGTTAADKKVDPNSSRAGYETSSGGAAGVLGASKVYREAWTMHSVVRTWDQFKQRSRAAASQQQRPQSRAHQPASDPPTLTLPKKDHEAAPLSPISSNRLHNGVPPLNPSEDTRQDGPFKPTANETPRPPTNHLHSYPQQPQQQHVQQQQPQTRVQEQQQKSSSTEHKPTQKQKTTRPSPIPNSSITPWVRNFVISRPADGLVPVPRDYLADNFNLVRLPPVVEHLATKKQEELQKKSPNLEHSSGISSHEQQHAQNQDSQPLKNHPYALYRQALDLILSQKEPEEKPSQIIQYAAEVLYGFIHARFVVSTRGLDTLRQILILHASNPDSRQPLFGRCPRIRCGGMPLLPCGLSDDYDLDSGNHNAESRAKRYCCNCRETFNCWESKVDGSAWGTSACHLLLMIYGKEKLFPSHFAAPYKPVSSSLDIEGGSGKIFAVASADFGHIFGFPVHPSVTLS